MKDRIELLINDCLKRERKLTDWEVDFLEDIRSRYKDFSMLTTKQVSLINTLWGKATEDG